MTEPSLHQIHPTGTGGDEVGYRRGTRYQAGAEISESPDVGVSHGTLCLSKTSKCLSGRELYFFYNSLPRCSFLSRRSSPLCPRSSVRALPSSWRTWLCATKSACFSGPRENAPG